MKKIFVTLALMAGLAGITTTAAATGHDPVAVCHYTPDHYQYIVIDDDGLHGHGHHANDVLLYDLDAVCPTDDPTPDPSVSPDPQVTIKPEPCPAGTVPGAPDEDGNTTCQNDNPGPYSDRELSAVSECSDGVGTLTTTDTRRTGEYTLVDGEWVLGPLTVTETVTVIETECPVDAPPAPSVARTPAYTG